MATCEFNDPISRRDVLKMRGRVHYRGRIDGAVTASKWPRRRGRPKSPLQQAWNEDFTAWAKLANWAAPCVRDLAERLACDTGFFWRDVITYAGHGKLLWYVGGENHTSPLPMLWTERSPKQQYGAPRVTTPTAQVRQSAAVACVINTDQVLTPNTRDWDNNVFWSPTENPSRLTIRANGLYTISNSVEWSSVTGGFRRLNLRVNGTDFITNVLVPQGNANAMRLQSYALYYFTAGDYVESLIRTSTAGLTAQLTAFNIVAITPEAII